MTRSTARLKQLEDSLAHTGRIPPLRILTPDAVKMCGVSRKQPTMELLAMLEHYTADEVKEIIVRGMLEDVVKTLDEAGAFLLEVNKDGESYTFTLKLNVVLPCEE